MLKYKIPQVFTLIRANHSANRGLKTKKDRQEWKPLNSLKLFIVAGPRIELGTS